MDYVKRCVNTRFELASPMLQDKWLCEQFQTWTQIITARILSDMAFKQALLDSCGSPLCDPDDPVYSSAMMSSRNMCAKQKELNWPPWIESTHPPNTWTGGTLIGLEADEIDTVNISCRATITTSSCTDKLHCLCVTMIEQCQSDY